MKDMDIILKEERINDISIKDKTKLYSLYDNKHHTVVGRHIRGFKIAAAALAVSIIFLGASAGFTLYDAVKSRTERSG